MTSQADLIKFRSEINKIRSKLNRYNIYLYNNNNQRLNFNNDRIEDLIKNFNYARLYKDLYKKQQEINNKQLTNRYKQYHKNMQINTLNNIFTSYNHIYDTYYNKLTPEGKQRNINDIDMNNRTMYKRFRPFLYSRQNPKDFRNKWQDVYRSYSLNSVYNDNLLNENIERNTIEPLLQHIKNRMNRYKYKITVELTVEDLQGNQQSLSFSSPHFITVDNSTDLYGSFLTALLALKNSIINKLPDSQLRIISYDKVFITTFRINNINGSSYIKYTGFNKGSIINPQNNDNKCFYWAVSIGLIKNKLNKLIDEELKKDINADISKYKPEHLDRISDIKNQLKKLKIKINDTMLKDKYPIKVEKNEKLISEFEQKNNISLNIYIENDNKKDKYLGYHTHNENKELINLLLICDKNTGNFHYVFLKNVKENNKKDTNKYYLCRKCNKNVRIRDIETHYKKCVNPQYIISTEKYKDIYTEAEKLKFKSKIQKHKYIFNVLKQKEDYKKMIDYYTLGVINEDYICPYCQNIFKIKEALEFHKNMGCAVKEEPRKLIFKNEYVHFKNHLRKCKMDTFIISDFESVLIPIEEKEYADKNQTIEKNTQKIYLHSPLSYCLYLHSDKYLKPQLIIYNGKSDEDTMKHFYKDIFGISHYYKSFMKNHNITIDEIDENLKNEFRRNHNDNKCYICGEEFDYNDDKLKPVLDHDHITGELLGMAHSSCNGKRKREQDYIPLYFYNGVGYDDHFIIHYSNFMNNNVFSDILNLNTDNQEEYFKELENIDVDSFNYEDLYDYTIDIEEKDKHLNLDDLITKNSERFLSFSLNVQNGSEEYKKIKVLDYLQMKVSGSLEKNVELLRNQELRDNKRYFKTMEGYFKENTDLLLQKNLLPYKYFDSYEKINNPIEELMNEKIYEKEDKYTPEKLEILKNVVKKFNVKTAIEYYNIYLKCDVLQLTDIILTDREHFYNYYGLDLCYYVGAPSYSWDAFLYSSKVNLEKIKDTNMYSFFRHGMRGGQSYICTRYEKANNIYCEDYDENKPYTYIDYFDMTNLYGGAMKLPLPYKDFELINNDDIKRYNDDINNLWLDYPDYNLINPRDDIDINKDYNGCWLCVDLKYDEKMHDYFYDYPLAPEHFEIKEDLISDFTKDLQKRMNKKHTKQILLTQTLFEKNHYYIYYKTLYLYQSLGMKITKIHYGYKFKERALMREFIMKNTKLRNEAKENKDEILIVLFKLMNNSVYGKTMENEQKYSDSVIVNEPEKLQHYASLPTFKNGVLLNEENFLIEKVGSKTTINKPIYLGATICELAKLLMYNFYYRYLIPEFKRENVKLLFTDTDSLCVLLTSKNEEDRKQHYKNLINNKVLDCSTYKKDENKEFVELSKMNGNINEIGTMKCEEGDKILYEFVGLRSKMYSILFENEDEEKKCKGVNKKTMEEIRFENYKEILFNSIDKTNNNNLSLTKDIDNISSKKQIIHNIKTKKIALSADDTKRFVLDDGINTLPYGYKGNKY